MKDKILELLNKEHILKIEEINEILGKDVEDELNELANENLVYFSRGQYYDLKSNDLGIAKFTIDKDGNYYLDNELLECKKKTIESLSLMNKDMVLYRNYKGRKIVERVVERNVKEVIGTITKGHRNFFNVIYPKTKLKYIVNDHKRYNDKFLYKAKIVDYDKNIVEVIEEIGSAVSLSNQISTLLKTKGVKSSFNQEVVKEVKQLEKDVDFKRYPKYKDYTKELLFTIDGDDAKDFDDAVGITKEKDNYILTVAIADVSAYVKEGSSLDHEAIKRGTSIYFLNQVIPMLPFELSNDLCSLRPNAARLALVLKMVIDKNGEVINHDLNQAIIKSKRRLTYNYVNDVLEGKIKDDYLCAFKDMLNLSKIIRNKRHDAGAINFKETELSFEVVGDNVINIIPRKRKEAELIIEDFMIVANETIATIMRNQELPMIYRHHDIPKTENLKTYYQVAEGLGYNFKGKYYHQTALTLRNSLDYFNNSDVYTLLSDLLLRSMSKAVYATVNSNHFALALDNYCHFTSPIRRYPDLIVHRMLHKYILDKRYDDIDEDYRKLEKIALKSNENEVRAVEIERTVDDFASAHYMKQFLRKSFEAKISSVTSFGLFVKLENGVEGLVHIKNLKGYYEFDEKKFILKSKYNYYHLGMSVKVILTKVDLVIGKLEFKLIENRINKKPKQRRSYGKNKRNKHKS